MGPLRAVSHRRFATLLSSALLYKSGFWLSNVALQAHIVNIAGNDPALLGALGFFNLVPLLLVAPIGGVFADRVDRRIILLVCQLTIGVSAAVLGLLIRLELASSVWMIFGFASLWGAGLAMNEPAYQAATADSVPRKDLASAISLTSATSNVTRLTGPSIAALVIGLVGLSWGFAFYSALSILSAVIFARLPSDFRKQTIIRDGPVPRLVEGVLYTWHNKVARNALLLVAGISFLCGPFVLLMAPYAQALHGTHLAFVWLVVAVGAGGIMGVTMIAYLSEPLQLQSIAFLAVALGVSGIALGIAGSLLIGLVVAIVYGVLYFAIMAALNLLVQYSIEEGKRGRVLSLFIMCWGGLLGPGALALGILAGLAGVKPAMAAVGGIVLLGATSLRLHLRKNPAEARS